MFGFLNRARPLARLDSGTPRDDAIAAARMALEEGAKYLTRALGEAGIECAPHLAGKGDPSAASVASLLERALNYQDGGRSYALRLGKTPDFETYDLEPHYRYREIHLLIEDLERLASGNVELRRQLIRQHAAHALIQSRLLSYFLLRVAVVERLCAANDMKEIEREMQVLAKAIAGLTVDLSDAFARGLDLPAIRQEWNTWPHIIVVPVDGR
jgi:hypothetical protein